MSGVWDWYDQRGALAGILMEKTRLYSFAVLVWQMRDTSRDGRLECWVVLQQRVRLGKTFALTHHIAITKLDAVK